MRPFRSRSTCEAVVGETCSLRFALGAASGARTRASSARAAGCDGARTATVGLPPVTSSGTRSVRGSTSVSGPGQKRVTSSCASIGQRAHKGRASSSPSTCTMSGFVAARPLAA